MATLPAHEPLLPPLLILFLHSLLCNGRRSRGDSTRPHYCPSCSSPLHFLFSSSVSRWAAHHGQGHLDFPPHCQSSDRLPAPPPAIFPLESCLHLSPRCLFICPHLLEEPVGSCIQHQKCRSSRFLFCSFMSLFFPPSRTLYSLSLLSADCSLSGFFPLSNSLTG